MTDPIAVTSQILFLPNSASDSQGLGTAQQLGGWIFKGTLVHVQAGPHFGSRGAAALHVLMRVLHK